MRDISKAHWNCKRYKGLTILVLIIFNAVFLHAARPILNIGQSSGNLSVVSRDNHIIMLDSNIIYDAIYSEEYYIQIGDSNILDSINIIYGIINYDTMIITENNAITKTGNNDYNVVLSLMGFIPEINSVEQFINNPRFPYYIYFIHNYNLPELELNELLYRKNTPFTNMVNTVINISTVPSWLKFTDIVLSHLTNIGLGVITASYTSRVFNCTEAGVPIGICCTIGFSFGTTFALIGMMLGKSEAELVYLINNTDILQKEMFLSIMKQFNDFMNMVIPIGDYESRCNNYLQYTNKIKIKKEYYYEY